MKIVEKSKKLWKEHKVEIIIYSGAFVVGSIFSISLINYSKVIGAQKGFTACNELFNNMIEDTLKQNPELEEKFTKGFANTIKDNIKNGKIKVHNDGTLRCKFKV